MTDATKPTDTETILSIIKIQRMSIDLFEFWLNYDWDIITKGIYIMPESLETKQMTYIRWRHIAWSDSDPKRYDRKTTLGWGQTLTNEIVVQIDDNGVLHDKLIDWINERFWDVSPGNNNDSINEKFRLPVTKELTPTEKKVAGYLAEGLSYGQIAARLDRSEASAKKHAQHIAKKWNVRQIPEILWDEAKRRGFGNAKK